MTDTYTIRPLAFQTSTNVYLCAWCGGRIDGKGNPHSCKCTIKQALEEV